MRLLESGNPFLSIRWKFLSKFLGYLRLPPPRNELTRVIELSFELNSEFELLFRLRPTESPNRNTITIRFKEPKNTPPTRGTKIINPGTETK